MGTTPRAVATVRTRLARLRLHAEKLSQSPLVVSTTWG
jgi:hypothetical protein